MNILFLTRKTWPHVGGVEKHIEEIGKRIKKKGNSLKIISEDDIKYLYIKFLGLFQIWFWLFKNRKIIEESDIVHVHDVFIWYLPFRFLYPFKKVLTTFHGWEEIYPIPFANKLQKKIAWKLSNKTIAIGKYIEKYYSIKANLITYGAASINQFRDEKVKNSFVYVGRLEENTGILEFLKFLDTKKEYTVDFCGDGRLRKECEKYGKVHGFVDPFSILKKAEYCIPGGYLAALEGLGYSCKLKLFWNNKIKEDYWKLSPFIKKDASTWAKSQTWEKLTSNYLRLYGK